MLIAALVMAVIGLAALVTAIVTSNALIAWVCIGASAIGVVLLIIDALRDRQRSDSESSEDEDEDEAEPEDMLAMVEEAYDAEYPDETSGAEPESQAVEAGEADEDSGSR